MAKFTITGPTQTRDFFVSAGGVQKLLAYCDTMLGPGATQAEKELYLFQRMVELLSKDAKMRSLHLIKKAAVEANTVEAVRFEDNDPGV